MFNSKKIAELEANYASLLAKHCTLVEHNETYVECDKCGVLVSKKKATKKQEIVEKYPHVNSVLSLYVHYYAISSVQEPDKVMRTYYLCAHCSPAPVAPKKLGRPKKNKN